MTEPTGYTAAVTAAALFDVSTRGKLEVAGRDAAAFLHNLCTNDIRNLAAGFGCEAFFTTSKARVVAPALIYHVPAGEDGGSFWLDTDPGLGAKLLQHLDHYLISEQVELTDRTAEFAQIHLAGPRARAVLEQALQESLPDLKLLQLLVPVAGAVAGGQIRRHEPLGVLGYDLLLPRERLAEIWQTLVSAGACPAGPDAYEVLRVEAGTPVFGPDIDDNRLVMEVNRTAQAISYTKGCFLGQEPIVMARDRGHVNRFLVGLKLTTSEPPAAGAKVFREGQEVGQVTSSVYSPRLGTAIALAYLRRGTHEAGTTVDVGLDEPRHLAVVTALPFLG